MKFEFEVSYTNTKAIDVLDSELYNIKDIEVDKIEQSGFDGLDILFYFIVVKAFNSVIESITKIIIKMIERNDVKSFKFNNVEFKGYNEKEVEKMMEKFLNLLKSNSKKK